MTRAGVLAAFLVALVVASSPGCTDTLCRPPLRWDSQWQTCVLCDEATGHCEPAPPPSVCCQQDAFATCKAIPCPPDGGAS